MCYSKEKSLFKFHLGFLLLLLLILLSISGCDKKKNVVYGDPENAYFTFVYDKDTHDPLVDCRVYLNDANAEWYYLTGPTGFCLVSYLGKGPRTDTLFIGKDGYKSFDTLLTIPPGETVIDTLIVYLQSRLLL